MGLIGIILLVLGLYLLVTGNLLFGLLLILLAVALSGGWRSYSTRNGRGYWW